MGLDHSPPILRVSGYPGDKADRVSVLQPRASQSPSLCSVLSRSKGKSVPLFKDVDQKLSCVCCTQETAGAGVGGGEWGEVGDTSELSMRVCGADRRCSEEGGLDPHS